MPTCSPSSSPIFNRFFAPLVTANAGSVNQYSCKELSDLDHLEMGVVRAPSESKTG